MIPFYKPTFIGTELNYIKSILQYNNIYEKYFIKTCEQWMEKNLQCKKVFLTPSCTASLEMAAILINIQPGDEVIMSSFTFSSTANAFALRGAKIIFIDIRSDTMNIDEKKIEIAITKKTRVIVAMHYAGIACNMDVIIEIAKKYQLYVIEDAAQAMMSSYKNMPLGTIGDIGCYSFHETKNFTSGGEGGAILINNQSLINRAEIIKEKGTDRNKFISGQIDKYTWIDIGSNYSITELQAAYLWAQLKQADKINNYRLQLWNNYYQSLKILFKENNIELPKISSNIKHNGHIFFIKLHDIKQRIDFNNYLKTKNIIASTHYMPLHSSKAGNIYGKFYHNMSNTIRDSNRLTRLPLFYNLTLNEQQYIIKKINFFFTN